VSRVGRQQATLEIVATERGVTDLPIRGTLRREDVFDSTVDATVLDLTNIFSGGELLRATIINADDYARYGLTTAEPGDGPLTLIAEKKTQDQGETKPTNKDTTMEE